MMMEKEHWRRGGDGMAVNVSAFVVKNKEAIMIDVQPDGGLVKYYLHNVGDLFLFRRRTRLCQVFIIAVTGDISERANAVRKVKAFLRSFLFMPNLKWNRAVEFP